MLMRSPWLLAAQQLFLAAVATPSAGLLGLATPAVATTAFVVLNDRSARSCYGCRRRRGFLSDPLCLGKDRNDQRISAGTAEIKGEGGAADEKKDSTSTDPSTTAISFVRSAAKSPPQRQQRKQRRKVAVLICPAQFCVPSDYGDLVSQLLSISSSTANNDGDSNPSAPAAVVAAAVAPLPRTEWIKVARQLPTPEFVRGELNVPQTLGWYFDAMDRGVSNLLSQLHRGGTGTGEDGDEEVGLCVIGHSIGGWVARAYLGGMSLSSTAVHSWALERCTSFITLGTPHLQRPLNDATDPSSAWSPSWLAVDQTRGLLRAIDENPSCRASALVCDRGIDVTCVCSDAISGGFANGEQLVALASYLPLLGRPDPSARGDGIVPLDLAFLEEPARKVILRRCDETSRAIRHSHVLPTPWNLWNGYAPSIPLPDEDFSSYVSPGVLSQWARYIR